MKDLTAYKKIQRYIDKSDITKDLKNLTKQKLANFLFKFYKDVCAEDEFDMEYHTHTQNLEFTLMINLEDDRRLALQLIKELEEEK